MAEYSTATACVETDDLDWMSRSMALDLYDQKSQHRHSMLFLVLA